MMDGNEAAASAAYRLNEVCAIYPITPSSTMAELCDEWSAAGKTNIFGTVPTVVEMQSEGGAAGTMHGALQSGTLTTTFTASQGLLLMIPNMYKIAGELTPAVMHVAARAVATHALSIFGDHSDVMAVRSTGWALLCASSVQEAHDMATIAQAATLSARVPFVHFFDGFRTSHEINKIALLSDDELRALIDFEHVLAHRRRALSPEHPVVRGTAQNPDVFFQSREAINPYYSRIPDIVEETMESFSRLTGRSYKLFDYFGDPQAERVLLLMGSGVETARETVESLRRQGERVGVVQVHLYRPFSMAHLCRILPQTTRVLAVLDRTKEPGALGEPLYVDVITGLCEAAAAGILPCAMPRVVGGRYGLGSKEFTPAMVKAVFDELQRPAPRNHFTVGIHDDVTSTSLEVDKSFVIESARVFRALFFGLGSDGTVSANKNSIKILGEDPAVFAQGYFVYDSKKSGSQTVSHLRFGPEPIHSTYLIEAANFIGCHNFGFLDRIDVLGRAAVGATLLLDSPFGPDKVFSELSGPIAQQIIDKRMTLFVIDAQKVAKETGMGAHTSTIMQTCFFAISGVLPREQALDKIRAAIQKSYGKKGDEVVRKNFAAIEHTLACLAKVPVPDRVQTFRRHLPIIPDSAPAFVQAVTARLLAGRGDELPVSAFPVDGTYPNGTARWEKRNISPLVAAWEPELCIQCGNCSFVCPHSVIRAKFYPGHALSTAPDSWKSAPIDARGFPDIRYTLQVYLEDCTGCGLCVKACPAMNPKDSGHHAINLVEKQPILATEQQNIAFFDSLPQVDRACVDFSTVRGTQYLEPLFEFSGACAGCGETPYLKLMSQLFGDRLVVANATGCSSIYGGNLPTTPWTQNAAGHGPAWSNSLFEDNAEFGLGFRLAADQHLALARRLLSELRPELGVDSIQLVDDILSAPQTLESELLAQRARVEVLRQRLLGLKAARAQELLSVLDHLVRRSVWIVGGDGWAYDIGSSGVDHVLASGRDVNILVLDTEVYSNTGGQASKATPLGAVAKFAAAGKRVGNKDLVMQAISYGNVYVARVAFGAHPQQTLLAFREAEAYPGPALILAYSPCIAHGIDMQDGLRQQELAVHSGYWPLLRYNPAVRSSGENPFVLDSPEPRIPLKEYAYNELRYRTLSRDNPEEAERLLKLAQESVRQRFASYSELATRGA
jgi:pyruvate-ferredoxin/flavodoxin oxidoreductase